MSIILLVALLPLAAAFVIASMRDPIRIALPAYALTLPFGSKIFIGSGPFGSLSSLLGLTLVAGLAAQLLTTRPSVPRIHAAVPLWLAFLGLAGTTIFWSVLPLVTADGLMVLSSLVVMYVLLALVPIDRSALTRLENALILGGLISVGYGLTQLLFLGGLPTGGDSGGGPRFGNDLLGPNHQAACLLLPLAIALSRIATRSGAGRAVYAAVAALHLVGILMTGSRSGLIATAVTMLGVVAVTVHGRRILVRYTAMGAIAMLAVLILTPGGVAERVFASGGDSSGRNEIWRVGAFACQSYCATGSGWATFPRVYAMERASVLEAKVLQRGANWEPHNVWMLVAIESGVIGAVLVAAGLLLTLIIARRLPPPYRAAPFGATVGVVLTGFFLSNLEYKYFWLALAYVVLCQHCAQSDSTGSENAYDPGPAEQNSLPTRVA